MVAKPDKRAGMRQASKGVGYNSSGYRFIGGIMQVKRGKDSLWRPIKFKGDGAIYARCKCGFYYPCYKGPDATFKVEIDPYKMYHYCPQCGARKKRYLTTIERLNRTQWE